MNKETLQLLGIIAALETPSPIYTLKALPPVDMGWTTTELPVGKKLYTSPIPVEKLMYPYAKRNEQCPCGSGSKFKKCCVGKLKPEETK